MGLEDDPASAPDSARPAPVWSFALVAVQLALVLLVVRNYEIGSRLHFFPVLCIAVGGFFVHACLPPRFRLAFFSLLSLAVVVFALGWSDGAFVLGIGGGLIGLCYLPAPFALRVAAAGLVALVLAFLRLDVRQTFWPLLGSMFMFRLIVFLHELRRTARRPPLALTAAYFFPLQNVCFLFFPILDFKTFRETYRPDAGWRAAQSGVVYLVRGLSHLFAYRVIKYYVLPSPHQLGDAQHVALFLAANYALYLHVSGYFHIITGLFHLFGFELPRTHHNYFLASSFTDIWRRINIPWKEFMAKLFFFPAFFAARRLGTRPAIVVAALWAFAVTWVLHNYQVFWLTGRLPLRFSDAVLWFVVGVLVAWNLQRDLTRAREPQPTPSPSVRAALVHAARVVGMFTLVSFFWACWSTPGFLVLLRAQVTDPAWRATAWPVVAIVAGLVVVGAAVKWIADHLNRTRVSALATPARLAVARVAVLVAVVVIGLPAVAEEIGPVTAQRVREIGSESVTPAEAARAVQGYYEEIADTSVRGSSWLAFLEGRPEPPKRVTYTEMSRPSDDLLERELIPGCRCIVHGHELTINQLGMRDRLDRTLEKPAGTRRVAVVGSSIVMGFGVRDNETFAVLLEERLNANPPPGAARYEVLNFGTGMSYAIQRHVLIDRKVFGFAPDAIYYVAHQDELMGSAAHLAKIVANGGAPPYPGLSEVFQKAGVAPGMSWGEIEARLQPHGQEIVSIVYQHLVAECRRRRVGLVWVYLPMPGVTEPPGLKSALSGMANRAGFVVLDLSGWDTGHRPDEVKVSNSDHHATALGHRLIAERLEAIIRRRPEILGPP